MRVSFPLVVEPSPERTNAGLVRVRPRLTKSHISAHPSLCLLSLKPRVASVRSPLTQLDKSKVLVQPALLSRSLFSLRFVRDSCYPPGNLFQSEKGSFSISSRPFYNQFSFSPFAMKFLNFVCCLVVLIAIGADAETEFICEFSSRTLACPHGKSLDIKFANFGRIGHNVCFRGYRSGADRVNNCYDESHTDLVGMLCNGQSTCLLPASNEVFGDTCPGVLKYLQVKYHCV